MDLVQRHRLQRRLIVNALQGRSWLDGLVRFLVPDAALAKPGLSHLKEIQALRQLEPLEDEAAVQAADEAMFALPRSVYQQMLSHDTVYTGGYLSTRGALRQMVLFLGGDSSIHNYYNYWIDILRCDRVFALVSMRETAPFRGSGAFRERMESASSLARYLLDNATAGSREGRSIVLHRVEANFLAFRAMRGFNKSLSEALVFLRNLDPGLRTR